MAVPSSERSSGLALELLGRRLREAPAGSPLRPGDDFRDSLRERLLTVGTASASVALAPRAPARPASAPRRARLSRRARNLRLAIRVSVAGVAASTVVTGVAFASERALPGDALYPVKRAAEGVQLDLAGSDTDRGLLHLEFASTRLHEVRELVAGSGPTAAASQRVLGTLRDMDSETTDGATLLTAAYLSQPGLSQPGSTPLARLVAFTRAQETTLQVVLPALPKPAAATSLGVLRAVQVRTTQLLAHAPSGQQVTAPAQPTVSVAASPSTSSTAPAPSGSTGPSDRPTTSTAPGSAPATTPTGQSTATPPVVPATSPVATASAAPSDSPTGTTPSGEASASTTPSATPSSTGPSASSAASADASPSPRESGSPSAAPSDSSAPADPPSSAPATAVPSDTPPPAGAPSQGTTQGTAGSGTDAVPMIPAARIGALRPW